MLSSLGRAPPRPTSKDQSMPSSPIGPRWPCLCLGFGPRSVLCSDSPDYNCGGIAPKGQSLGPGMVRAGFLEEKQGPALPG